MDWSSIAAVVCARLAHNYGPAADAGAAIQIQRELETALAAAAAAEREACAKLAQAYADLSSYAPGVVAGQEIAKAIRARIET
jgi:hypothetical protein